MKRRLPTAYACSYRLRFFQPTRRPQSLKTDWMDTPWGRVRITGRLGQRHADLIDSIMYASDDYFIDKVGRLQILFDPHKIRMILGGGKQAAGDWMHKLFNDLCTARMEWDYTHKDSRRRGLGGIIVKVERTTYSTIDPLTGGNRSFFRVVFSEEWTALVKDEIEMHYNPALIAGMKHGVSQAVARLTLTHKKTKNGVGIETVLDQVGIPHTGVIRRKARRRLVIDRNKLSECGICVEHDKITLK